MPVAIASPIANKSAFSRPPEPSTGIELPVQLSSTLPPKGLDGPKGPARTVSEADGVELLGVRKPGGKSGCPLEAYGRVPPGWG